VNKASHFIVEVTDSC